MDQDQAPIGDEETVGEYVVLLIDLLNQGKQLDEWNSFPKTSDESVAFRDALERTAGEVAELRKSFKCIIESYIEPKHQDRGLKLECQTFSDTVVLYSRLADPGCDRLCGLESILFGSAAVLLFYLARGIPIRGGIEIGMATNRFPGEIYGPALRRAYLLEQNLARYPRIVVGDAALACVRRDAACVNTDTEVNRMMANTCLSLIGRDHDGANFVDFLGDGLRTAFNMRTPEYCTLVKRGHAFAKKEHERFMEERKHELARRYALLRQYYESRMS